MLDKYKIMIWNCRQQSYVSKFKEQWQQGYTILYKKLTTQSCIHPLPKSYTELGIANVCKNSPIQRFMTSLTVARNFLDTSSRRQQYFEHFINLFKKYLFFSESKIKHIKGLSKPQWVEKHKAYDTIYIMCRLVY